MNNKSENISEWSNKKVKEEYEALAQEKYLGGIRLRDQLLLDDLRFELEQRGG
uniref:Uncharacterized protein n=1 Tax=viral metagenome TaxID=1070528 RepID=A0A6M3LTG8_9ZZZZ